jgi:hypothetical protein
MRHQFETLDASRESVQVRAGFCGPAGSGKTWTTLQVATILSQLLGLGQVWLIDSERGSACRHAYSKRTRRGFRFKTVRLPVDDFSPETYIDAIEHCESEGAQIIIIDSLSHVWNGTNGVLEQVDRVTANSKSKNTFSEGWKHVSPRHNRLVQRILSSPAHVFMTFRSKVDWVLENVDGKMVPTKKGLAPIMRDDLDYELDVMFRMSASDNSATVSKTRCHGMPLGEAFEKPGFELAVRFAEWVLDDELPRAYSEAFARATRRGVEAMAQGESGRPAYAAAREELLAWCRAKRSASAVQEPVPVDKLVADLDAAVREQMKGTSAAVPAANESAPRSTKPSVAA